MAADPLYDFAEKLHATIEDGSGVTVEDVKQIIMSSSHIISATGRVANPDTTSRRILDDLKELIKEKRAAKEEEAQSYFRSVTDADYDTAEARAYFNSLKEKADE